MPQSVPVRRIQVADVTRLTPRMARMTFGGDELADFTYDAPDLQAKLCFPREGQTVPQLPEPVADDEYGMRWYQSYLAIEEPERPWMRQFTIRSHDPDKGTITIDFILHSDEGPAARWAASASVGDEVGMVGPSPVFAQPIDFDRCDWLLLAGDETALPAISTLVEALPEGKPAIVFAEVADAEEEQQFDSAGDVTVHWLHRDGEPAGRSAVLPDAVANAELPDGAGHAWLAGEASTVRTLRRHLVGARGMPKTSIDFTGYWRLRLTQDDAPTDDDVADAQERLANAQAEVEAHIEEAHIEAGDASTT